MRDRCRDVWAATLTGLLGVLFVGLTAVTLLLWRTTPGPGASGALLAVAAVATGPAAVYAADMLDRARAAGPSCFFGQCVRGDRYAEAAALGLAVVVVALLASMRPPGWMLPAWAAGTAAVVLGAASLIWPGEVGAVHGVWAVAALVWGCAFILVAHLQHQPLKGVARRDQNDE